MDFTYTIQKEQLDRQERMEEAAPKKDFGSLDKVVVGVCPGDGIGPAITGEAVRVLEKLLALNEGRTPDAVVIEGSQPISGFYGSKKGEPNS